MHKTVYVADVKWVGYFYGQKGRKTQATMDMKIGKTNGRYYSSVFRLPGFCRSIGLVGRQGRRPYLVSWRFQEQKEIKDGRGLLLGK